MAIATTAQAILRGRVSTYLSANYMANGALYGARLAPKSPITIALVTDALDWGNSGGGQSSQSVRLVTNYLIWLIGMFGQEAQFILEGGGGGSVIPIIPSVSPSRIDFYVTDSTTVATGESSVVISQFIGYNLDFYRGNLAQSIVTDGFSTYFSWDKVTGTFTCFGAANEGELFSLIPYL